jgi:hypothetical protein
LVFLSAYKYVCFLIGAACKLSVSREQMTNYTAKRLYFLFPFLFVALLQGCASASVLMAIEKLEDDHAFKN